MQKSKNNVVIIDGYGFVFRAFFSLGDLKTSKGEPVGAVYGFINMLLKVINTFSPNYLIVVFDSGTKSFRSEIYPEYKSHRKEAPEDLKPQFAIVREAVNALNLKYIDVNGFEADDLIATYSKICKEQGFKSVIVSSDKDLMQVAEDGVVEFFDPMKEKFIKEADIKTKFGVLPSQIVDFLAILGDASDHIPGVAGIGEKGASELLSAFLNLEDIYNNIEKVQKTRLKQALINGKEKAFLSKKLAELKFDVPVKDVSHFKVEDFNHNVLFDFLNKYELKSIIGKLLPNYKKTQPDLFEANLQTSEKPHKIIDDTNSLEEYLLNVKDKSLEINVLSDGDLAINTSHETLKVKRWWAE
jgi:DNA polymerase-1